MIEGSTASKIPTPPVSEAEAKADQIIAERGDARSIIIELLTQIDGLKSDNKRLARAASCGFSPTEFLMWP
jgi:hypothetical protein